MAQQKKGKQKGRPADREIVKRATNEQLANAVREAGVEVFNRIRILAKKGDDIPISLLGAARMCAEWHTDYETVKMGAPDLYSEGEDGGGKGA